MADQSRASRRLATSVTRLLCHGASRVHAVCNLRPGDSHQEVVKMARYSRGAGKAVKSAMRRRKRGSLKSGRSGKRVTSRKQGAKVPRRSKRGGRRKAA